MTSNDGTHETDRIRISMDLPVRVPLDEVRRALEALGATNLVFRRHRPT